MRLYNNGVHVYCYLRLSGRRDEGGGGRRVFDGRFYIRTETIKRTIVLSDAGVDEASRHALLSVCMSVGMTDRQGICNVSYERRLEG